jgi:hypothetical protein
MTAPFDELERRDRAAKAKLIELLQDPRTVVEICMDTLPPLETDYGWKGLEKKPLTRRAYDKPGVIQLTFHYYLTDPAVLKPPGPVDPRLTTADVYRAWLAEQGKSQLHLVMPRGSYELKEDSGDKPQILYRMQGDERFIIGRLESDAEKWTAWLYFGQREYEKKARDFPLEGWGWEEAVAWMVNLYEAYLEFFLS